MIKAERACATCNVVYPATLDFFYKNGAGQRSDGLHSSCKPCELERIKWKSLKTLYGMSKIEYLKILVGQDGRCKTCGAEPVANKRLCVDHNHTTGEIRGLLCRKCNLALGHVDDRIDILQKMIDYLKEYTA